MQIYRKRLTRLERIERWLERNKIVKSIHTNWDRACWAIIIVAAVYAGFVAVTAFAATSRDITIVVPQKPTTVQAVVTAYTSSVDETDSTPFITASGVHTRRGIIACPGKYKFGTIVEFNGVRYECQDRMNIRYREDSHFDVWVKTKTEAFNWGAKQGEIVVVSEEV